MSDTEREGVTFACEDCGSRVEDAPMRPATCVECGGAFEVETDDVDLPLLLRSVDRGDEVRLRKEDGSFVRGDVRRIWHEADDDEVRLTLSGDGQASYEIWADAGDKLAAVTVTKVMGSGESAVRAGRDRVVGVLNLADHPGTLDDHRDERVALVGCGESKWDRPMLAKDLYNSNYFDKKHAYAEQDDVDAWFILSAEYGFVHPDERIEPYDTHIDDVDADDWCGLVQEQMPHLDGSTVEVLAGEQYFEALDLALDFAVGTDGVVERPLEGLGIGDQMAWLKENTAEESAEEPEDGTSELTEDNFPSIEDLDAHGDPVHCGTCKRNLPGDPVLEVGCPVCGAEKGEKCSRPSGHSGGFVHPHGKRDTLALAWGITPPCPEGIDPMTPEEAAAELGMECQVDQTDPFDYKWPWFVDGVTGDDPADTPVESPEEMHREHDVGDGVEDEGSDEETTLVNMSEHGREGVAPIDRSTQFGNPFRLEKDGGDYTREGSIEAYREWFAEQLDDEEFREAVEDLRGETIGCWCKPKACHGDVIVEYLREGEIDVPEDDEGLPERVNGWTWSYGDVYGGLSSVVETYPWVQTHIIEAGEVYQVTVDGPGKTEPVGLVVTDDRTEAVDELLAFVRETTPDEARAAIDPRIDIAWGAFEVPEQPDDTNFECEDCGHRDHLNSDVDVRRQSCVECGGDMVLDGADADTTEQATLAPDGDGDHQEEHDADPGGCVAIIDTTGEPCGNSVTTEASDTSARLCGNHAKASSVKRADAVEGSPDPDLRDQLVDVGMNGSHAYYLATIADSAADLWRLVTGAEAVEQDDVTYEASTLATQAPTVARLEAVDAEGHPLAYDGCVAVIDSGARGEDYRCGSGGYAHKLLCGTHQDTNPENLRTVFDADAPDDLRIDAWPEVSIGDDRFLAVEQRDGDLLAISIPEFEYRRLEGFGYLVDELEDAGDAREDDEGNQSLTATGAGDVQEPSSEEIDAEAEADDEPEDDEGGQTWVEITEDGSEEHTSTAPEPAFLDEHPEESQVRVELEDGRVYTGEVVDHGTGGWRNDARSLYIHADAVRGSLMVYCNRQDDGSWGDLQALDKLIGAYDDLNAGEDALGAVASIEQIVDKPDREGVLDELVPLLEAGLSPSQALDYWATEDTEETHGAFTQQEWAEIRDVSRQAVGGNAGKAREVLNQE